MSPTEHTCTKAPPGFYGDEKGSISIHDETWCITFQPIGSDTSYSLAIQTCPFCGVPLSEPARKLLAEVYTGAILRAYKRGLDDDRPGVTLDELADSMGFNGEEPIK